MTSPHLLGICGSELMLDMKVRANAVGWQRGESSGYSHCATAFLKTGDSAVSTEREILLPGKTVLDDILLPGNISLKMLSEITGASGIRNGALDIWLWQGFFFFFYPMQSSFSVLYCTTPPSQPAAKSVGEPYDRADRYSLMILIFEKHLGAQPQLSGARPILMIFSPILTSKMLRCRSECGVMHADG